MTTSVHVHEWGRWRLNMSQTYRIRQCRTCPDHQSERDARRFAVALAVRQIRKSTPRPRPTTTGFVYKTFRGKSLHWPSDLPVVQGVLLTACGKPGQARSRVKAKSVYPEQECKNGQCREQWMAYRSRIQ